MQEKTISWLGFILQMPLKPAYHRVKIWRRLCDLGAINLKSAIYLLPKASTTFEDLQWVKRETESLGGEGVIIDLHFLEGITDKDIQALFVQERDADYKKLLHEIGPPSGEKSSPQSFKRIQKMKRKWESIANIDFLKPPHKRKVLSLLEKWEMKMLSRSQPNAGKKSTKEKYKGAVWVTRQSIGIDRMACAWLIRKFIDPKARFKFVEDKAYNVRSNEIAYDMFSGDFSHQGDKCTFEVLIEAFPLKDLRLQKIAQIIHDLDMKDDKFGMEECPGIKLLIEGIQKSYTDDLDRLGHSNLLFDNLYASFGK